MPPVDWLPDTDLVPDHAPAAVQEFVLVDDQVSVAAAPLSIAVGVALNETLGAGGGGGVLLTSMVTDFVTFPPLPEHVNEKVLVVFSVPVGTCVPASGFVPLHAPEAEQLLALSAAQESSDDCPCVICAGLAASDSEGGAGGGAETATATDFVVVPPFPRQVSEKLVLFETGPVDSEPVLSFPPDQPPDAMHVSASVEFQEIVAALPATTEAGAAEMETVGAGTGSPIAGVV
jgi:hypothetical protein